MKILVAGGLGFVGGRVAKHLAGLGHEVLRGSRRDVPPDELSAVAPIVRTPLFDTRELESVCAGVDVVIKASGMNARECADDPALALKVNGGGTAAMVDAAVNSGVRRFLYVSTVHVYTDRLEGSIGEDHRPSNPHPYATSNRAAEDAVFAAHDSGGIDGVVTRLSNGYGVPVDPRTNCWMLLVNDLCRQSAEAGSITLASNGLQSRNFIPLSEVCSVLEFLTVRSPLVERIGRCGPINVGGRKSFTVLEMARLVQSRCESVIGFSPTLSTHPSAGPARETSFEYRTERLQSLGFRAHEDPEREIDDLLIYCHEQFGRRK